MQIIASGMTERIASNDPNEIECKIDLCSLVLRSFGKSWHKSDAVSLANRLKCIGK